MKTKKKNRFCYLVYCNPDPLVYGVYSNKKSAIEYAKQLISWRFDAASQRGYDYGYYHYVEEEKASETPFDRKEKIILSACLKIKDNLKESISDDGCYVKVVRREIDK